MTMTERYNLLDEAVFDVRGTDGRFSQLSLPETLAALARDEIQAYARLQAHQAHAWHAFLVQLAAAALHRAGNQVLPEGKEAWREYLLRLTDDAHQPWALFVEELALPAFMQPPIPDGKLDKYKEVGPWPDALDVLQTAKNHDVKSRRMRRPSPDQWVFSLVSLQTMQGFSGRGNYGIARMNGGFASRPMVGLVRSLTPGSRFVRDVEVLLAHHASLLEDGRGYRDDGQVLLWLLPWDGRKSLGLKELNPFFVEICRRVRLVDGKQGLTALTAPSDGSRVHAKELKGDLGDPWTPIRKEDGAALTIGKEGFHYKRAHSLMFGGDYTRCAAQKALPDEGEMRFRAIALARGQGITEGYHSRDIPLPKKILPMLEKPDERDELAERAKERVETAAAVRYKVLRFALKKLAERGELMPKYEEAFERDVDRIFFEELWRDAEVSREEASAAWQGRLLELAKRRLNEAMRGIPMPSMQRFRYVAEADRAFFNSARKHCPRAFDSDEINKDSTRDQEEIA